MAKDQTADEASPSDVIDENNKAAADKMICPKCGSELVFRTAKKGANAGNQFYGCSAFPKCRYTQQL